MLSNLLVLISNHELLILFSPPVLSRRGVTEWFGGHLTASQGQPTTPSNPHIKPQLSSWTREAVWDYVQGLKEAKIHYTSCSSLPLQRSGCITEKHQISQVRFALCKAMWLSLITSLSSICLDIASRGNMIHDLIRHRKHPTRWWFPGSYFYPF